MGIQDKHINAFKLITDTPIIMVLNSGKSGIPQKVHVHVLRQREVGGNVYLAAM